MSFNLSSDEEDEEALEELWKKSNDRASVEFEDDRDHRDACPFDLASATSATAYASIDKSPLGFHFTAEADEESEEDSVAWEEAGDSDEGHGNKKLPADNPSRQLQAVTINIGQKPSAKKDSNDNDQRCEKVRKTKMQAG